MNTFGQIYRLTTFGESHGKAIGGVIDGVPANFKVDTGRLQDFLDRRKPGQSALTTARKENDSLEILSGIFEGKTLGTPVGFIIRNADQRSGDYEELRTKYRPGHADYTYDRKFGVRDYRGGGRASARETAARVVGGALASQILEALGVKVYAYTSQIGDVSLPHDFPLTLENPEAVEQNPARCPDSATAAKMADFITRVKSQGDTAGGIITGVIEGMDAGMGEPVFDKFQAVLAHAMMSINAAKGFEYGAGFAAASRLGSELIDTFYRRPDGETGTLSNHSGGIQGGITNGEPIYFRVAFKPVATLLRELDTVDVNGHEVKLQMRGRHDACVVPRAVPIVEAMAAMCALDAIMLQNARKVTL